MPEKNHKILVLAESIDVDDSSGSKANVAFIRNLKRAGFHLEVCHYTRKEIKLDGITCISIKENRRSLLFILSRIERYFRYWFNLSLSKPIESVFGFSFTLFNDRNSILTFIRNRKSFEPDLVLTLSKGASFRPHHALLKYPRWHSKWMAYIHDPYPFASYPRPYDFVESGHQQKRKFFLKLAGKTAYAAYPSKLLAEWMESYYNPLKGKAVIIPHQVNPSEPLMTGLPGYFRKDAFTIVHAGALMNARNPLGLIRAYKRFLAENPKAGGHSQLLFLGKKSIYTKKFLQVKEALPQLYSSNEYIPFSTILLIQHFAAINVILEAKGAISPFLPGKFPHCIQAGKPILLLGPPCSESRRLLGPQYPWYSEIDDEEKICKILSSLYSNWLEGKGSGYSEELHYYLSFKYLQQVMNQVVENTK